MKYPPDPIRIEEGPLGDVHVYYTSQIDLFGFPENWGVFFYCVVSNTESPMVTDWKMEQERRGSIRPIHRYNRVKRFESTLFQLIGERGVVSNQILSIIKRIGYNSHPDFIWESLRCILKSQGLRQYYNRIPSIIARLGHPYKLHVTNPIKIVNEFKAINQAFKYLSSSNRKYFPNLRFICLKMLERHNATFDFRIPLIRTPRKLKPLQEFWKSLIISLPK